VFVSCGTTGTLGLSVSGLGTGVVGAAPDTFAGLGFAPVETGSSAGAHLAADVVPRAAVVDFLVALGELPWTVRPPPDVAPPAAGAGAGVLLPPTVRVLLPSVPAVARGGLLLPWSAVLA
jgi:hypothetical protein